MHLLSLNRILRRGALIASALLGSASLLAQAQFAGQYFGTINTRVTVPVLGTTEAASGAYIATVTADGAINVSGTLIGTVSASGAVTFTSGTGLAALGIRSATIANNQLSSNYGDLLGNGTTQFRLNPSTSFTGSGGGGGTGSIPGITSGNGVTTTVGATFTYQITASNNPTSYSLRGQPSWVSLAASPPGIVTGVAPAAGSFTFEVEATNAAGTGRRSITIVVNPAGGGGGGTVTGDLLAYYSFNNPTNPLNDDSGRGFHLTAIGGAPSTVTGRAGSAISTNRVRFRTAVNSSFSVGAYTISYFVKVQGPGNWNPRMVAVQVPGSSTHYYGTYVNGATSGSRRFASYHLTNRSARIFLSPGSADLPTNTTSDWQHIAVTHDGSTVTLYLNGNAVLTQPNAGAVDRFASAVLMIAGSDNGLDLFQGQLDEIRIYNRAVTAAEVVSLRNGTGIGTAVAGSNNTIAALPATVIGAPFNLAGYRSRVGQSFEFLLTGTTAGGVWGTDVYTDDSNVARAAVHAGVVAPGETKTVTVTVLPGQTAYAASIRNGVTSAASGPAGGSFAFAGSSGTAVAAGTASVAPTLPASYRAQSLNVVLGGRFVLPVPVTGTGPFTYQWFLNGVQIAGATANPYVLNTVTSAAAGTYTVRVGGPGGTQTFTAGTLTVPTSAAAPQIVLQPFDKVVAPGGTFALAASALGTNVTYQWLRNGNAISAAAGGTNSILLRQNADATDTGDYTVRMTAGGATVTSTPARVTIDPNASRLGNLSGRIAIGGADKVIPGFFISGAGKKRVLVRAVGPGLAAFGVGGTMADPKFEIYDGATKIAENNDWAAATAAAFGPVGAFGLPANSRDAAGVFELDANKGYSIHVFSNDGQGGVVLFEVYDAGNVTGASKFTNVAVRGPTGSGDSTLILGLNIAGTGKRTLLTRGIGPQLAAFGVPTAIVDPQLEIFDGNQRSVLTNNDWSSADFVTEMLQAREFVGAFELAGGSADASTLALLDPGSYTMQITAAAGETTGEALVEIYEVP